VGHCWCVDTLHPVFNQPGSRVSERAVVAQMSYELEADMSPSKRLRDAENEAEAATGSQEGERGAVDVVGDRLTPP